MKKTFWFLMLVVVILPTFGFTTADAFVKLILDGGQDYRWEEIIVGSNWEKIRSYFCCDIPLHPVEA